MVDEERSRILRLVSEGQLSPDEAADLLEALEESHAEEEEGTRTAFPPPPMSPAPPFTPGRVRRSRVLIIQVREGSENGDTEHATRVNLRIPLGLARAAGKFIPRSAENMLKNHNIDLQEIMQEFLDSQESGPIIQVNEGDSKVLIAVE